MQNEREDLTGAIFTLVIGALVLAFSTGIEVKASNGDVGSAFFPYIVGIGIVLLSLYTIITSCIALKKGNADLKKAEKKVGDRSKNIKIALTFALLIVYVACVSFLGFLVMSIIYLFLQICIMSEELTKKKLILYLVISIVTPILVNYIFVNWFSMVLPTGIMG